MQLFEAKTDKEKVKRKRKKKDNEDKDKPARRASNASSSNSTTTAATTTETPKKRRRKDKDKVTKVKQEEMVDVEDDDDDDDADEICAAPSCSRPSGDEVGWVQCDVCEKWYHLACVGLSPERAEAMDSYNCRLCVGGGGGGGSSATNSAVGTSPVASPESENIDVDGTTPTSPTPPVSIVDVEGTETAQQQEQESAVTTRDPSNSDSVMLPVTTIDLCSDDESTNEDMPADDDVVDVETGHVVQVDSADS